MKSLIEYYYNIKIDELFIENDIYHFKKDEDDYYFAFYNRDQKDLDDILDIIYELKKRNINCGEIIINVNNSFFTTVENSSYVLIKFKCKNKTIDIVDIIKYNKLLVLTSKNTKLFHNNWSKLWSSKIDALEDSLNIKTPSNIIKNSIDYYIGLSENAICYVNNINQKYYLSNEDHIVLSRKRVSYPNYVLNYFNPLSFIFDLEVRDVAEYIKSIFFKDENLALLELKTYLKSVKLTIYSLNMLFARLLYPSYYFDLYEKSINNKDVNDDLLKIISKQKNYESFLRKAYDEISLLAPLENITYLKY